MTVIDATDLILGRMLSVIAKRALLGEKIDVINCESAVITGDKLNVLNKYKHRRQLGGPQSGPYYHRSPNMFAKRMLRGMLPYKKKRGRMAFERVKFHVGVPSELEGKQTETVKEANISKLTTLKIVRVEDVSKSMGARSW